MTIATVGCTIVIVLHPTANAQSPDPQQQCSTEAKRVFEDLRRTYDAEVRGLQLRDQFPQYAVKVCAETRDEMHLAMTG